MPFRACKCLYYIYYIIIIYLLFSSVFAKCSNVPSFFKGGSPFLKFVCTAKNKVLLCITLKIHPPTPATLEHWNK